MIVLIGAVVFESIELDNVVSVAGVIRKLVEIVVDASGINVEVDGDVTVCIDVADDVSVVSNDNGETVMVDVILGVDDEIIVYVDVIGEVFIAVVDIVTVVGKDDVVGKSVVVKVILSVEAVVVAYIGVVEVSVNMSNVVVDGSGVEVCVGMLVRVLVIMVAVVVSFVVVSVTVV